MCVYRDYFDAISSEYNASILFAVRSLPTRTFHGPHPGARPDAAEGVELCSIPEELCSPHPVVGDGGPPLDACLVCLEVYREGDVLKELPCGHAFHLQCIDAWLLGKGASPPGPTRPSPRALARH